MAGALFRATGQSISKYVIKTANQYKTLASVDTQTGVIQEMSFLKNDSEEQDVTSTAQCPTARCDNLHR